MKKGITPVVALILLLVIVIVVVGFAFGVFQGVVQSAGEAAQSQSDTTSQQITRTVRVDAVAPSPTDASVTVRNLGSNAIAPAEVAIFVNGVLSTDCQNIINWNGLDVNNEIAGGGFATCSTGLACVAGSGTEIKATSPSGASSTEQC